MHWIKAVCCAERNAGQVAGWKMEHAQGAMTHPLERLVRSYRSAFSKGQGGQFLHGEHYANSAVKRIGIALPFASAVLADSIGASARRLEC